MLSIGLTGSIGMGKSTTADMFRAEGVPVYDSDKAVHDIYAGPAAPLIEREFPGTTVDGAVDRARLSARVLNDPAAMKRLEAIVHPLVWAARDAFIAEQRRKGAPFLVYDIPLLFETGKDKDVDVVIVVSAAPEAQKERVLARPSMTEEKFAAILARQTPDEEKRRRADFVVHTDHGLDAAREEVRAILKTLAERRGSVKKA